MTVKKRAAKTIDLAFFDRLFRGVWARLVPQLGVTSVRSILEQTLREVLVHYPVLEHLRVRGGGIDLGDFSDHSADAQPERVEQALWAYLETLTNLLGRLSGEGVSKSISSYILSQEKGRGLSTLFYRTGLKF